MSIHCCSLANGPELQDSVCFQSVAVRGQLAPKLGLLHSCRPGTPWNYYLTPTLNFVKSVMLTLSASSWTMCIQRIQRNLGLLMDKEAESLRHENICKVSEIIENMY